MEVICKNCDSSTQGKYCDNCGQRTSINKVTFKETFQDFVDTVFSVNSPLLVTLKLLITNPGKLFREYLSGKRKTYYKPVSFFILTTIIYVLIKALLNYDPMEGMVVVGGDEKINLSLFNEAGIYMAKNINNIVFVYVFTFALTIKLFFFKQYTLAEYFAVSFYVIGFYMLFTTLLMFYLKFVFSEHKFIPLILILIYIIYAFKSLFKMNIVLTVFKGILVYSISFLFYIIFGYSFSLLVVWLKLM